MENHRHKQNKLASMKRGEIYFDYEASKKLIEGKYHEEFDLIDDSDDEKKHTHELKAHKHHFMDTIEL